MPQLREPPPGPDDEPVRKLMHKTCPICLGEGAFDDGFLYDGDNTSNVRTCHWCGGVGYVLAEQPSAIK